MLSFVINHVDILLEFQLFRNNLKQLVIFDFFINFINHSHIVVDELFLFDLLLGLLVRCSFRWLLLCKPTRWRSYRTRCIIRASLLSYFNIWCKSIRRRSVVFDLAFDLINHILEEFKMWFKLTHTLVVLMIFHLPVFSHMFLNILEDILEINFENLINFLSSIASKYWIMIINTILAFDRSH
jgi:hypothetical protein